MKPLPQFFALLRYHATASPWIWVLPFAFGIQPLIMIGMGSNWRSLNMTVSSLSILTTAPLMIASFVFAVEKMFGDNRWLTGQTHHQVQSFSGDFLLTRAIDRVALFRARVAFYWLLIMLPFVVLLALVLWRPELRIELPLKTTDLADFYLSHLPGAEITKTTKSTQVVTSPHGNVALGAALTLFGLAAGAIWQSFVFVILPWRFRRAVFYAVFLGGVMSGPLLIRGSSTVGGPEYAVIWTMNHLAICAVGVLILAFGSYLFSASREREVEYP
jgi:hypothetical protein